MHLKTFCDLLGPLNPNPRKCVQKGRLLTPWWQKAMGKGQLFPGSTSVLRLPRCLGVGAAVVPPGLVGDTALLRRGYSDQVPALGPVAELRST